MDDPVAEAGESGRLGVPAREQRGLGRVVAGPLRDASAAPAAPGGPTNQMVPTPPADDTQAGRTAVRRAARSDRRSPRPARARAPRATPIPARARSRARASSRRA